MTNHYEWKLFVAFCFMILIVAMLFSFERTESIVVMDTHYIDVPVILPCEQQDVEDVIRVEGSRANLSKSQIDTLQRIAYRESRYLPTAKNKVSTASGVFQVLHGTWDSNTSVDFYDYRYDPRVNTQIAIEIFKRRGTQPWGM